MCGVRSINFRECEMWIENNSANWIKTHIARILNPFNSEKMSHFVHLPNLIFCLFYSPAKKNMKLRYEIMKDSNNVCLSLEDKNKVFLCKYKKKIREKLYPGKMVTCVQTWTTCSTIWFQLFTKPENELSIHRTIKHEHEC